MIGLAIPLQPMSTGLIDCVNKGHAAFFSEQVGIKDRSVAELEQVNK